MNSEFREESEEERRLRRKARLEEMKREKKRAETLQKCFLPGCLALIVFIVFCGFKFFGKSHNKESYQENITAQGSEGVEQTSEQTESVELAENEYLEVGAGANNSVETDSLANGSGTQGGPNRIIFQANADEHTSGFGDAVVSEYGIVIDVDNATILAQEGKNTRISPASMTKILTILTAADALEIWEENWEQNAVLQDKFSITREITDYSYVHDCSNVGFDVGEEPTVKDLFYGTILPSGADAAVGLACYVAGSQEAFVELMNRKLEELGLSQTTHFTNCVGLYDEEHYSTVYDIAVLLKTATDIPFCRAILSAHTYTTTSTTQHPDGILVSNWFLRRIEDKDTHGEVLCAKTGFVVQSKNCAASLAKDSAGKEYICVTAGSTSSWRCIYDHVELYQTWMEDE